MSRNQTAIHKDMANRKILITRTFEAPLPEVWKAWTDSSLLDQWWAPKPWRAETKSMDFREGGRWIYCMVGPDGTRHWSLAEYHSIEPEKSITATDAFCDEQGNKNTSMAILDWTIDFIAKGNATDVGIEVRSARKEDLEQIIEMGFEEGFTAAHGNLDELLADKSVTR